MEEDLEKIEQNLKQKKRPKQKQSGRSVFDLQRIIQEKKEKDEDNNEKTVQ